MSLPIAGLVKLDVIDYPGKITCVLFTQGCNFRCRFCHNPSLLCTALPTLKNKQKWIEQEQKFLDFLDTRIGKLDAVVITGGEPTLHPYLPELIRKIKSRKFLVKLDSQGTNPQMLRSLLQSNLVDYVAMDLKHIPEKYQLIIGKKIPLSNIEESIKIIQKLAPDYEFRTTAVPGLHSHSDLVEIARWVKGTKRYYLQEFRPEVTWDASLGDEVYGLSLDLQQVADEVRNWFDAVEVRG